MATVTAALVKELRDRTAAGMMECKKALVESNGDIELAIENMRKSGAAKAAKKAAKDSKKAAKPKAVSNQTSDVSIDLSRVKLIIGQITEVGLHPDADGLF